MNTTLSEIQQTMTPGGHRRESRPNELLDCYRSILGEQRIAWTAHQRLIRLLGSGGQGVVYLSERRGADHFTLPIAIKIFSPEHHEDIPSYEEAMGRIARVAALVAQIQQDNLLDVHDFLDRSRVRMMVMEWIDGFDLRRLLTHEMLTKIRARVSNRRWEYVNQVIVTEGPIHPRVKPGVAVAIVRGCLAALAALHRQGIVHGDIKPSNIMLKRTGNVKIIDIGSAFEAAAPPTRQACTPSYAAPEVLEGNPATPQSDLASLGYVLVEMLSGRPPFAGISRYQDLLSAKRFLAQKLHTLMPAEVTSCELLMNFCRGLVAPDPSRRFSSAEKADLVHEGAAAFHRQLVMGDLSSEYENEIRLWLEELPEAFEPKQGGPTTETLP